MNVKQKSVMFAATGCFVGNISFAPGTLGSMMGLPLCFLLSKIAWEAALLLTILFIFFSIKIAQEAESILNAKDPGCIVIDEIAGIMVTFIGLPFNMIHVVLGFAIFRVIDITKPYPIRSLEKKLTGGTGIVMDDVAAGVYSNILLRVVSFFCLQFNH
ncbi:MAG: phosphatidylglycerophosphatase A [Desulfobacterales bacterium]|nr:MAG: phosphatidylglycerophosphatase A [Desulfobacterales bacterium]UCD91006.1 MAG: phosphatidylglycerophosphatase A [Desulfobacterales bacterium]